MALRLAFLQSACLRTICALMNCPRYAEMLLVPKATQEKVCVQLKLPFLFYIFFFLNNYALHHLARWKRPHWVLDLGVQLGLPREYPSGNVDGANFGLLLRTENPGDRNKPLRSEIAELTHHFTAFVNSSLSCKICCMCYVRISLIIYQIRGIIIQSGFKRFDYDSCNCLIGRW